MAVLQYAFAHPWVSALLSIFLTGAVAFVNRFFIAPRRSPLRNLPGPDHEKTYIFGNLGKMIAVEPGVEHKRLLGIYGETFRYTGLMGEERLCSTDPTVFNHFMNQNYDYPKPKSLRKALGTILGEGVLTVEGDIHKRHRRTMLPSFSGQSIRSLFPIFMEKAVQITQKILEDSVDKDGTPDTACEKGASKLTTEGVNVLSWMRRGTLDAIGLAGFEYDFHSLGDETNELSVAFKTLFETMTGITFFGILQELVPVFKIIRTPKQRKQQRAIDVTERIGRQIIAQKKRAVLELANEKLSKNDLQGRDILASLVRANMASDLVDSQKMSDEEVVAQIRTFILAGFETSSTALTWMLNALSNFPDVQTKLREEVTQAPAFPSFDEINALPYLDAFVKECLRVDPPVTGTVREANKDDIIPLSKPIKGVDGNLMTELHIAKGTHIFIPVLNINLSKNIYGDDAHVFRPERWLEPLPESANRLDVPFGHQATFLGGPRGCIGYRFALAEIKAFLFQLVRQLKFEHINPKPVYERKSALVQSPRIKGREAEGFQLLLQVRAVEAHEK